MALLLRTHIKLAKASIRENRTRSFLTCLGIAIGVGSIILIMSLTGSVTRLISDQVKGMGADLIVVRPETETDRVKGVIDELAASNAFRKSNLTLNDVKVISETENVVAVAPVAMAVNRVIAGENALESVPILGTNDDFVQIQPVALRYGTFLDDANENKIAVVGHTLSLQLFNTTNPVGKTLTVMGERFIVMGVLTEVEDDAINFNNIDFDNALILEASELNRIAGSIQIQQINVKAANTDSLATVADTIKTKMTESKMGDKNFSVAYGDAITHPANTMFDIVSAMLTLVAGISLVVGGIGVMNIMLVSVAERTHEIGIRKAVGASSRNILLQFLFEALILSLLGGFLGLILGYIMAFFISVITPFTPFISLQIVGLAFGTSLLVGVVFGAYPAIKAAGRNPIESLKHYR